jgi:UDP-glucose 4-epimerase
MKQSTIYVTGGAGFIGTNLLLALQTRYPACVLVSLDIRMPAYPVKGVHYERVDVRNMQALSAAVKSDALHIYHLAAVIGTHESFENSEEVTATNIQGTLNVLEVAKQLDVPLFIAGMPGIWNNPYSISKDTAVRFAAAYYEYYKTKVAVLRWYSVYGPWQYVKRYNKAVPSFVYAALKNQDLKVYGSGKQKADFLYVEDAVNLAIDMLENELWGSVIACGSGIGISVNELCKTILHLTGSNAGIRHVPMRLGEPEDADVHATNTEREKVLKRPLMPLTEGLLKTIEFYKNSKSVE